MRGFAVWWHSCVSCGKTMVLWAILLELFVAGTPTAYAATYSGGSGTVGDPYLVSTSADLVTLSTTSKDWAKYFLLTTNIDMSGVSGFTPIGDFTTNFTGVFDGGGHAVQNLTINLPAQDYVGLFGYISDPSCQVKDLGMQGSAVTGQDDVGGLVGCKHDGTISGCYATGAVTGNTSVGGLVGDNFGGTVSNSYATGAVSGGTNLGGLVGNNGYGTVTASFWDTTTGGPDNGVGTGIPTGQMKQRTTFESVGWDFSGSPPVWYIFEGQSYPQIFGIPMPIDSIDALQALASVYNGNYFLTNVGFAHNPE